MKFVRVKIKTFVLRNLSIVPACPLPLLLPGFPPPGPLPRLLFAQFCLCHPRLPPGTRRFPIRPASLKLLKFPFLAASLPARFAVGQE